MTPEQQDEIDANVRKAIFWSCVAIVLSIASMVINAVSYFTR